MRGGGEINLPVDGSPPLGLESTFAPTLSLSRSLSPLFSTPTDTRGGHVDSHLFGRKEHLVNSPRLVINSTLVGHGRWNRGVEEHDEDVEEAGFARRDDRIAAIRYWDCRR